MGLRFKLDENIPREAEVLLNDAGLHSGIWILRPPSQNVSAICSLLVRAMRMLEVEPAERHLWIVDTDRVRIRD